MARARDPVPRAREAGHWLIGILLLGVLGGGVVAAGMLLWESLDVRRLVPALGPASGPLPEPEPAAPPALAARAFDVVLFDHPRNRSYFPDAHFQPGAMEGWAELVESVGGTVRMATDVRGLESVAQEELLVLVEAPCLSSREVAAIRGHLARGGSVLSNWAVGARDEACEWRGWGLVAELAGGADVREIVPRKALFLTVPGGLPLSPGIDPGTRVELRPDPSLAVALGGPRIYWSDWALNPRPAGDGGPDAAVAAFRTKAGGRGVWFGLRASQAVTPADSLRLRTLLRNGVAWSADLAMASPAPWPSARRAALVFAQEVEAEPRNALRFAELADRLRLPASFFPVSGLVQDDGELGRRLAAAGEVGTQTPDHAPLAGLDYADQLVRLRRARADIERWAGVAPAGLRPPEETFDRNTLRAWSEAGGRYLLAATEARTASPELHRVDGRSVVVLPRLMKDDYNVIVQDVSLSASELERAFVQGVDKLRALGGIATLVVHTQILESERRIGAVRAVADRVRRQRDWWLAPAGDVAAWWEARSRITIRHEPPELRATPVASDTVPAPAPGGPTFRVGLPDGAPVDVFWIDVVLPEGGGDLVPLVDGRPVEFIEASWGIRVPVRARDEAGERTLSLVPPLPS